MFRTRLLAGLLLAVSTVIVAGEGPASLEGISVTARGGWLATPAAPSTTFIGGDDIRAQLLAGRTLADALAQLVPGMAPSTGTFTNYSQTVRGRSVQVLIDGVPQGANRDVSRDLFAVDPDSIERIEVIRGASTLYGGGASGGLINVVTKNPLPGQAAFDTRIGLRTSLTEIDGDGFSYDLHQGATGGGDVLSWRVDATWRELGAEFDANGERIAPEPSQGDLFDATSLAVSGKLMAEWDDQHVTLLVADLDAEQDTRHAADPGVDLLPPGTVPARAIPGLELDRQNGLENRLVNLAWSHSAVGGSTLDAQLYHREFSTRFYPFDGRPFATWNALAQSYLESETRGARLALATPWNTNRLETMLTYGVDYQDEKTAMPITVYDGGLFDASNGLVFAPLGDRTFMPPTTHESLAGFAQWMASIDAWHFGLGLRHERVDVSWPDFVTLGKGNMIDAGAIDYSDTFGNAAITYSFNDDWRLFASYAEGFELPDIGLQLRYAPVGFGTTNTLLAPIVTDNTEIGVRYSHNDVNASIALFESSSKLGGVIIENFALAQSRVPERIRGVEATLDVAIATAWKTGGTFTWLEGEQELDSGDVALNSYRVPPEKLTAYVAWRQLESLDWRLQMLHSGSRDDAAEDGVGFGGRAVESYTVVDLLATWQIGSGDWRFGVQNLFNEDYYNVYSQLLRSGTNTSHLPASGRTLTVQYSPDW